MPAGDAFQLRSPVGIAEHVADDNLTDREIEVLRK